jgi:hypothetical protein
VICCLIKKRNEAAAGGMYVYIYKNGAGRATFVSLGMLLLSPQSFFFKNLERLAPLQ